MATIQKGQILRNDFNNWDGITKTASRIDSTGGTITGVKVGDAVDVLLVYGNGTDYTSSTINLAVANISTTKLSFIFATGVWNITENTTIPSNITSLIPAGCVFNISAGITLTFNGPIQRECEVYSSGSGTLTYSGSNNVLIHTADLADTSDVTNGAGLVGNAVQIVSTLTVAKTLTGSTSRDIYVRGRSSNNDGYEGKFYWDSSDLSTEVTSDTKNGFFIPPNSDNTGASGAWRRYGSLNHLFVDWFGAIGDGTTSDTAALQACYDNISLPGTIEYTQGKTYLQDDSDTTNAYVYILKANSTNDQLIIKGNNATLKMGAATGYCALELRKLSYLRIENIVADGNVTAQNYPGGPNDTTWDRAPFDEDDSFDATTTGLIGINGCNRVYANNIEIKTPVGDGLRAENCDEVHFSKIYAHDQPSLYNQTPAKYPSGVVTDGVHKVFYDDIYSYQCNISFGYSTSSPGDNGGADKSTPVYCIFSGDNLVSKDCYFRSLSLESPYSAEITNFTATNSNLGTHSSNVHVNNEVKVIHMTNITTDSCEWNNKNLSSSDSATLDNFHFYNSASGTVANLCIGFTHISNGEIEDVITSGDCLSADYITNVKFNNATIAATYAYVRCNSGMVNGLTISSPAATTGFGIINAQKVSNCKIDGVNICLDPGANDCLVTNSEFKNAQNEHINNTTNSSTRKLTVIGSRFLNAGLATNSPCIGIDWGIVNVRGCDFMDDQGTATTTWALNDDGNAGVQAAWAFQGNTTSGMINGDGNSAANITTTTKVLADNLAY